MRATYIIFKRELKSYFSSPIAYVVMTLFLLLIGVLFALYVSQFSSYSQQYLMESQRYPGTPVPNIHLNVFAGIFQDMGVIMLFLMPLLTMRMLAEEKRSGSVELLMTYPVRDYEVVLGKYLAGFAVFLIMLCITIIYPVMVQFLIDLNWAVIWINYLGLFLIGGSYLAIGILFSSLTENQIVAGACTFASLLLLWLFSAFQHFSGPVVGEVFDYMSLLSHQIGFTRGVIDSNDVVYFVSFIFLFLFLTLRTLESKKWRA